MNSPYNIYKANQVNTTSKERLVLMVYDGAVKYLTKAVAAIDDHDYQQAHAHLVRSQDIILALMSGLNMQAGDISNNLFNLYEYMHRQLVEANIKKDKELVERVLGMVSDLRDTWAQLMPQKQPAPKPKNLAVMPG